MSKKTLIKCGLLLLALGSWNSVPALVAAETPPSKGGPQTGPTVDFRNWRAGCDNVRTCHAYSVWSDEEGMNASYPAYYANLAFDRDGAATAGPMFSLHQESGHAAAIEWDHGKQRIVLKPLDDQPLGSVDNPAILQALRSEEYLSMVDGRHRELGRILLAGASAALLWLDDQQHRAGTVTALVKPGLLPASSIPTPPSVPTIHAIRPSKKPPATFGDNTTARLIGRTNVCTDKDMKDGQTEFHRIDAIHTVAIVTLECPTSFNNEGAIYLITDGARILPQEAKIDASDDVQGMWYDDGQYLAEGMDNHGVNDENSQDEFVWDGRQFVHSESHTIFKDGEIVTYRSKVIRDR